MALLLYVLLFDRYGPVLTVDELAECLGYEPGTVRNKHERGELGFNPLPGGGKLRFHVQDVAEYLDELRRVSRRALTDQSGYSVADGASPDARSPPPPRGYSTRPRRGPRRPRDADREVEVP